MQYLKAIQKNLADHEENLEYNQDIFLPEVVMDILITLVYLSEEQFEGYVKEIRGSNLPRFTQGGLIDLLRTARQHTEHARQMGWIKG